MKIYLAGPDVFLNDFGIHVLTAKKALCEQYGFEGISPMDSAPSLAGLQPFAQGLAIYRGLAGQMLQCDAVIANMTPFRGVSMDTGTAFEMGFMAALGKPVLGYTNVPGAYASRAEGYYRNGRHFGSDAYTSGTMIEAFDMTDNLMLVAAVHASGFEIVQAEVAPGQEMQDLSGFDRCLGLLKSRR